MAVLWGVLTYKIAVGVLQGQKNGSCNDKVTLLISDNKRGSGFAHCSNIINLHFNSVFCVSESLTLL